MAGWHGFLRLRMTRNVFEDSFCQANRILVFAKAELSGLQLFAHDLSHPFALPLAGSLEPHEFVRKTERLVLIEHLVRVLYRVQNCPGSG